MRLIGQLDLPRCPHCGIDSPMLSLIQQFQSSSIDGTNPRIWAAYTCRRCGGAVLASAAKINDPVLELYPSISGVDESVPDMAREFLNQAKNSRHAPAGAVMLAASSVDAMLKSKGLEQGSLYSRIDLAVTNHLITSEMGAWAHEVRLEANGQRHADTSFVMPTASDADRVIQFAEALAEFLFVLPARVTRGRVASS